MKNFMKKLKEKRVWWMVAVAGVVAAVCSGVIYFGVVKPALDAKSVEVITYEAPAVSMDTRQAKSETPGNPFAGRFVTYEGITGTSMDGTAFLMNPEDNGEDIFIEFVVSEDGKDLYSSELVPSGQGLDVDFGEFLSEGEHEVVITMNPYLLHDGEYLRCPVNNAQSLKVSV